MFQLVPRDNTRLDQRGIQRDGIMSDREQKAVAPLPFRIIRAIGHRVEIGHGQHIGNTERLRDIALPLNLTHPQRIATNIVGPFGKLFIMTSLAHVRDKLLPSVRQHPACAEGRLPGGISLW